MPRGAYQTVSLVDRRRLIQSFEDGHDWHLLADQLGVKHSTARSIILKHRTTGEVAAAPRGGRREERVRVTPEIIEAAIDYVSENPQGTLQQIAIGIQQRLGQALPLSPPTVSRILDGQLYTLKIARAVPETWNSERTKQLRREYAEWFMVESNRLECIFLDEFGINIWTRRTQGRAHRGQRAVRVVHGQRGRNFTAIIAVSPRYGLCHYKTMEGPMTQQGFSDFLVELSELFAPVPVVLIFDNAPVHSNPPQLHYEHHFIRRLPPYSPFLNPTENAGSAYKAAVKRSLSEPARRAEFHDLAAATAAGLNLHQHRLRILKRVSEEAMEVITANKCAHWFDHSCNYLLRCVHEQDIFD